MPFCSSEYALEKINVLAYFFCKLFYISIRHKNKTFLNHAQGRPFPAYHAACPSEVAASACSGPCYHPKASPNLHMKIAFFKSFLYYLHMKLHMIKTHLFRSATLRFLRFVPITGSIRLFSLVMFTEDFVDSSFFVLDPLVHHISEI